MPEREIDTKPMKDALERYKVEMESPLPTPPVGFPIVWFNKGDKRDGNERAAIVTRVEDPGKISVTIFPPSGMPLHKVGCLHVSHPVHEKRSNSVTQNSGSWDYQRGTERPESHDEAYVARLRRKIDSLKSQITEAEKIKKSHSPTARTKNTSTASSK